MNTKSISESDMEMVIREILDSLVFVKGGRFSMGGTSEQGNLAKGNERPIHLVELSDYEISKYLVTQKLWWSIMGNNPSYFRCEMNPVEEVSWYDCKAFIRRLNELTGKCFTLPTEAQWEYAARGGMKSKKSRYAGSDKIDDVAWIKDNSEGIVLPVGEKMPNELGLYDMSGNVWEWCEDSYHNYNEEIQYNPFNNSGCESKVLRGGSYDQGSSWARVSCRLSCDPTHSNPNLGFRLVCVSSKNTGMNNGLSVHSDQVVPIKKDSPSESHIDELENLCGEMEDILDQAQLQVAHKQAFRLVINPKSGVSVKEITDSYEKKYPKMETSGVNLRSTEERSIIPDALNISNVKLKVVIGNCVIMHQNVKRTMAMAILKLGIEKIISLKILCKGIPLISRFLINENTQIEISPGYYLMSYRTINSKKAQLEAIAKQLGVDITVEIVKE